MKFTETDRIIGDKELIRKWIDLRKKERVLINVSDICLKEIIHLGSYVPHAPKKKRVWGTIIVRPDITEEGNTIDGKYVLVSGWKLLMYAQLLKQEQIYAYITHTGRKKFADKLRKIREDSEKNKEKGC